MNDVYCASCDRDSVIKAYCFYSKQPYCFSFVYEVEFTLESFTTYAVEMELRWRTKIYCEKLGREKVKEYWSLIEPFLKDALRKSKS